MSLSQLLFVGLSWVSGIGVASLHHFFDDRTLARTLRGFVATTFVFYFALLQIMQGEFVVFWHRVQLTCLCAALVFIYLGFSRFLPNLRPMVSPFFVACGVLLGGLSFTPWVVRSVSPDLIPTYEPAVVLYGVFCLGFLGVSLLQIWQNVSSVMSLRPRLMPGLLIAGASLIVVALMMFVFAESQGLQVLEFTLYLLPFLFLTLFAGFYVSRSRQFEVFARQLLGNFLHVGTLFALLLLFYYLYQQRFLVGFNLNDSFYLFFLLFFTTLPVLWWVSRQLNIHLIFREQGEQRASLHRLLRSMLGFHQLEPLVAHMLSELPLLLSTATSRILIVDAPNSLTLYEGNPVQTRPITVDADAKKWLMNGAGLIHRLDAQGESIPDSVLDVLFADYYVPLRTGGKLVGYLLLNNAGFSLPLSNRGLAMVELLGVQMAIALDRTRVNLGRERNQRFIIELNQYCLGLNRELSFSAILSHSLRYFSSHFGVSSLHLLEPQDGGGFRLRHTKENVRDGLEHVPESVVQDLSQEHPVFVPEAELTSEVLRGLFAEQYANGAICLPLRTDARSVWYLVCYVRSQFSAADVQRAFSHLTYIQKFLSQVIHNTTLIQQQTQIKDENQELLHSLPVAVVIFNDQHHILSTNKEVSQYFPNVRVGKKLGDVSEFEAILPEVEMAKERRGSIQFERELTPDQRLFHVSLGQMEWAHSRAYMLTMMNMESVKELQQQVSQANRLGSLGEMAANIAHEIKNPLVAVKAFTQLVPRSWESKDFRRKFEENVGPQIDRINELCQSLLRLGKPKQPKKEWIHMSLVIEELQILMRSYASDAKPLLIRGDLSEVLFVDRSQLVQVLVNIVLNAYQSIADQDKGEVIVDCTKKGNWYVIRILDRGKGMAQDVLLQAKEPFFTTKTKSAGLGLTLVEAIVKEHGGHFRLTSRPDEGSLAILRIPIVKLSSK